MSVFIKLKLLKKKFHKNEIVYHKQAHDYKRKTTKNIFFHIIIYFFFTLRKYQTLTLTHHKYTTIFMYFKPKLFSLFKKLLKQNNKHLYNKLIRHTLLLAPSISGVLFS